MHIIIFYNIDFGRAVISSYRYCNQTWFRLPRVGLCVKNFENFQTWHPISYGLYGSWRLREVFDPNYYVEKISKSPIRFYMIMFRPIARLNVVIFGFFLNSVKLRSESSNWGTEPRKFTFWLLRRRKRHNSNIKL